MEEAQHAIPLAPPLDTSRAWCAWPSVSWSVYGLALGEIGHAGLYYIAFGLAHNGPGPFQYKHDKLTAMTLACGNNCNCIVIRAEMMTWTSGAGRCTSRLGAVYAGPRQTRQNGWLALCRTTPATTPPTTAVLRPLPVRRRHGQGRPDAQLLC